MMSSSSKQWMDRAEYDLVTAQAMFDSGRYLYVLFCCQQAVEKALKSLISKRIKELPPRIHQLIRLSEIAGLEMDESRIEFLRELSSYYIQSRYPEEIENLSSLIKKRETQNVLKRTQEIVQWIKSVK
jgi:HEPN domain-containing protein